MQNELKRLHEKYNTQFSITFNGWTVLNNDEYLAVIIHYLNEEWILQLKLLGMILLKKKYSGKYLLERINYLL